MEDLRKDHNKALSQDEEKIVAKGFKDERLPLFGYSSETIYMLLLPMINNK